MPETLVTSVAADPTIDTPNILSSAPSPSTTGTSRPTTAASNPNQSSGSFEPNQLLSSSASVSAASTLSAPNTADATNNGVSSQQPSDIPSADENRPTPKISVATMNNASNKSSSPSPSATVISKHSKYGTISTSTPSSTMSSSKDSSQQQQQQNKRNSHLNGSSANGSTGSAGRILLPGFFSPPKAVSSGAVPTTKTVSGMNGHAHPAHHHGQGGGHKLSEKRSIDSIISHSNVPKSPVTETPEHGHLHHHLGVVDDTMTEGGEGDFPIGSSWTISVTPRAVKTKKALFPLPPNEGRGGGGSTPTAASVAAAAIGKGSGGTLAKRKKGSDGGGIGRSGTRHAHHHSKEIEEEEEAEAGGSWTIYVAVEGWGTLTLGRTGREMGELEEEIRSTFSPKILPTERLPLSKSAYAPIKHSQSKATASPLSSGSGKRRNNVLATISRTLSPSRRASPLATPSFGVSATEAKRKHASPVPISRVLSPDSSSDRGRPNANGVDSPGSPSSTLTPELASELSAYLTKLATIPEVRTAPAWKKFFSLGKEDLESRQVEKRVKRVRSEEGIIGGLGGGIAALSTAAHGVPESVPEEAKIPSDEKDDLKYLGGADDEYSAGLGEEEARMMGLFPPTPPPERADGVIEEEPLAMDEEMDVLDGPPEDKTAMLEPTGEEEPTTVIKPAPATPVLEKVVAPPTPPPEAEPSSLSASKSDITPPEEMEADGESKKVKGKVKPKGEKKKIKKSKKASTPAPGEESAASAGVDLDGVEETKGGTVKEKKPRKVVLEDFQMVKVLGKGCAGKVLLVRHTRSTKFFAMKAIHKHHVLAHRELQHTLTEQNVLKRVAKEQSNPFVVKLWWSFHNADHLFLVLDFYPGGDLATQLARWGRLGRDRARFYAAEIVEGGVGLHQAGVIYRDLKPENVLIAADGHIVLTDFGLSRQFDRHLPETSTDDNGLPVPKPHWMKTDGKNHSAPPGEGRKTNFLEQKDTTTTFCGTAEYLAPEVLLGEPYSYEVDWWSFGTMLYEMLTGLTPFWSEDHGTMYRRVLHDELGFDDDSRVIDHDTKSLLRGLLQKVPGLRMTDARIKRHPYFSMIDWSHVYHKRYIPPYIPTLNPHDEMDTQNFDDTFLKMTPAIIDDDGEDAEQARDPPTGEPQSAVDATGRDVFDGYSYLGRNDSASILVKEEHEVEDIDVEHEGDEEGEDEESEESESELEQEDGAETGDITLDEESAGNITSSSIRSQSTRPTSLDRDASSSHLKDVSGATTSTARTTRSAKSQVRELGDLVEDPILKDDVGSELSDDDDWDMVQASDVDREDHNGPTVNKGSTLFSRGVVDKYRLLLRKRDGTATPAKRPSSRLLGARKESEISSKSSIIDRSDSAMSNQQSSSRPNALRSQSDHKMRLRVRKSGRSLKTPDDSRAGTPTSRQSERTVGPLNASGKESQTSDEGLTVPGDGRRLKPKFRVKKRLTLNGSLNIFGGGNNPGPTSGGQGRDFTR